MLFYFEFSRTISLNSCFLSSNKLDKCAAEKIDPVCDSDGKTHMTKCDFDVAKLENPNLKIGLCSWVRRTGAYGKRCQSFQPLLLDRICNTTAGS